MAEPASRLRVSVCYSPGPRDVREWPLDLPAGATVREAIEASGLPQLLPQWREEGLGVAVWGRKAKAMQVLRQDDRVEVLRPLQVDPKVARRERFVRQGSRAAGLFAKPAKTREPGRP